MNTYSKYVPNVFLAKCSEQHEKGETIELETKYGNNHECIVFNLIFQKDEFYYYSIVRADGFNHQEWAKRKAEKLETAAMNAQKRSDDWRERSNEGKEFLSLGEPIKVGHHSEKRHRALIERNWNRMDNAMTELKKAESYESRAEYWEKKASTINLSMPECIDFYEFQLEKAKANHEGLKNGTIKRLHSYSLTYAKKEVNDLEEKLKLAYRLWN
jgi:hypothetical protein